MATGAHVRVCRDNEWQNIEIDQLTDGELDAFANRTPETGWMWAKFLARWMRDNLVVAPRDIPSPGD